MKYEILLEKAGFAALKAYSFLFSEAKQKPLSAELTGLEKTVLTSAIKVDKWTGRALSAIQNIY